MGALVSFAEVGFRYAGADIHALAGVTLDIAPGELILAAGRPGAGTSTLLLVAGGYAPRVVGGALEGRLAIQAARPAIVFATPWTQLTGLCRTVFAEVAFGPASHGREREHIQGVAMAQMERLKIGHLAGRDPATLSGGELQRAIVAAALALEPDLLLLDDPAAELDPDAADRLYALLAEVVRGGTSVIVATPDLERAAGVATRALLLEAGRVVHDGEPGGVLA